MSLSPERLVYHREWRRKHNARLREKEGARRLARGDALVAYNAEYQAQNRERIRGQQKIWHEAHRSDIKAVSLQKILDDPIGVRARRAADKSKRKFGEYVSWEIYERLFSEPCGECGIAPSMGVDHIIEFADGGRNIESNLQSMCLRDNQRKAGRMRRAWQSRR